MHTSLLKRNRTGTGHFLSYIVWKTKTKAWSFRKDLEKHTSAPEATQIW